MRQVFKVVALTAALVALAGCGPSPTDAGPTSGDGRARLSAANSYAELGDFVVHANAMNSSDLTPEIASNYGITRSNDRALINLVVLRKVDAAGVDEPVKAAVELAAANLTGQRKNVSVTEVVEGGSIYYLSEVAVENRETVNFDFDIRPEGADRQLLVRFTHEFYTR